MALVAGFGAGSASAEVPACDGTYSQMTIYQDQGTLEALIAGNSGRLFVSSRPDGQENSALLRYGRPGNDPQTVATSEPGAGGLAWDGHRLLWGNGNNLANGSVGDETPMARLLKVNLRNGNYSVVSDHLGMANGVVRAANGAVYASNDFGMKLDRISSRGVTKNGWATVDSANGMAISRGGKYIFANQTFVTPSTISRIEIADPTNVTTWASAEGLVPSNVILDGLTRDNKGSLYAAAWGAGQIWKIDSNRQICVLASGIDRPSAVNFGRSKKRFRSARLFAVGFGGEIVQIKGARQATYPG
ncbi:MAG: SMP-30/gluconolactonase/LRE family protein [Solirubrobacterales bacterium]|nr:SMP-30/gluconolactonase/LRE family protein [Solirubrobacterales bacterium]